MSTLLYLGVALAAELGLDEAPTTRTARTGLGALTTFDRQAPTSHRSLEESRALLGLFWLTSVCVCQRSDPEDYELTSGTDSVVPRLASKMCRASRLASRCNGATRAYSPPSSSLSDVYLSQLIRTQQVADSIRSVLYRGLLDADPVSPAAVMAAFQSLDTMVKDVHMDTYQDFAQQCQ